MPEKKKYPKAKCEVEGCNKLAWKDRCCMVHYKEKHGIPRRINKVHYKEKHGIPRRINKAVGTDLVRAGLKPARTETRPVEAGIQNVRTASLAQLLYVSDLLDGQLNSAIENGIIDTKTILDIRFRLGAVLRGNVGIPPAEART